MKKQDLETGMFVELRDGSRGVIVNDNIVFEDGEHMLVSTFKYNLESEYSPLYDVMKVWDKRDVACFGHLSDTYAIWGRENKANEILDKEEKEYISAIIKPFRKEKIKIKKWKGLNFFAKEPTKKEYLVVSLEDREEAIMFPYFEEGEMYKGMELYKKYTPEELGL